MEFCTHLMPPAPGARVYVKYATPHYFGVVEDSDWLTQLVYVRNEENDEVHMVPNGCVVRAPKFFVGDFVRLLCKPYFMRAEVVAFDETANEYVVKSDGDFEAGVNPRLMQIAPPLPPPPNPTETDKLYSPSSPTYSPTSPSYSPTSP